ncbi:MAG: agmatine deiminase family protein, partial [Planctomycetales bacterium]|nr:agmatine deiminase family protein [Planctomycetales bacterium]
ETWPGRFDAIPAAFVRFITAISQVQPVHVLAGKPNGRPTAEEKLSEMPGVTIHDMLTNDTWIRDYGPTFVLRKDDHALVGVDWKYNAWGGKYPPFDDDARVAESVCRTLGCLRSMSALYCEGGALETDGRGTLLSTSSCLMNPSRNPGWTREMVENELRRQLGVTQIVWVDGGGLQGDDTDGHIDQLARFVAPGIVVAARSSSANDPNYQGLEANLKILQQARDARGEPLTVHGLPTPPPRFVDGKRVPESYCNFLFANQIVLVPTFRHEATDHLALDLFSKLLPERRVVPLDAWDLIWGLGAFHCASQQQPALPDSEPRTA